MFKILTIAVCLYFLYRWVFPPNQLPGGDTQDSLDDVDDGEYVDYEEVE